MEHLTNPKFAHKIFCAYLYARSTVRHL